MQNPPPHPSDWQNIQGNIPVGAVVPVSIIVLFDVFENGLAHLSSECELHTVDYFQSPVSTVAQKWSTKSRGAAVLACLVPPNSESYQRGEPETRDRRTQALKPTTGTSKRMNHHPGFPDISNKT
jgi:hypothetical protein